MKTVLYLTLVAGTVFDIGAGVYLWNLVHAPTTAGDGVRSNTGNPSRVSSQQGTLARPASPSYSRF